MPTRPRSGASASGSTTSCSMPCPHLRAVGNEGVGYDTIDVAALERRGIALCIPRGQNADAVADHALGLLLAVRHNIVAGDRFVRDGRWGAPRERGAGRPHADRHDARGDRPRQHRPGRGAARRGVPDAGRGLEPDAAARRPASSRWPLDDLLRQSDHVTIHCALCRRDAGPDRRPRARAAAADGGRDQHRAGRDRRLRGADRGAAARTGCGAPASTCSRTSRRSTRGCSSIRGWS